MGLPTVVLRKYARASPTIRISDVFLEIVVVFQSIITIIGHKLFLSVCLMNNTAGKQKTLASWRTRANYSACRGTTTICPIKGASVGSSNPFVGLRSKPSRYNGRIPNPARVAIAFSLVGSRVSLMSTDGNAFSRYALLSGHR